MGAADADRAFLALQAEHTAAIGPGGTGTRLDLAARAIVLGSAAAAMNAPWYAARARERCAEFDRGGPLSPRETEVAREVAAGLTNRAIAARLHISERTVEQHVRSILRELGLSNRSGIAVWTVRHGD